MGTLNYSQSHELKVYELKAVDGEIRTVVAYKESEARRRAYNSSVVAAHKWLDLSVSIKVLAKENKTHG